MAKASDPNHFVSISIPGVLNNSLPAVMGTGNRISQSERRRTISLKMLSHQNSTASDAGASLRQRSLTPEPSGPPFERLDYPLSERRYDEMLRHMPPNHERLDDICKQYEEETTTTTNTTSTASQVSVAGLGTAIVKVNRMTVDPRGLGRAVETSGMNSAAATTRAISDTESNESVLAEEPDPNDPEWVDS